MDSDKSPKDSDESDGDDSDYLAGFDLDKEVEGYLENLQSIPIELLRPKDDEKPECNESKSKEEDEEETEPSLYSIVKSTLEANQTQEQDVKANTLEKIDSEEDDEDNLYRVTENIQLAKYNKDKKLALMKDDNSNSGLEAISDNDLAGDDIESGEYYSSEEEGALDKSDPQVVDMDISDGEANVDHKPVQRPANHMFDDIKTLSITVSNSLAYEKSLNTPNKKPISKEEYEKNKVILEEYYRKCDLYLKQMMKRKTDKKKKKSKNSKKLKSIVELPKGYTKSDHGAKLGLKKDKEKMKHIKERGRPSLKLPEKKRRSSHNKGKKSEHKYKLPEKINKKHKHYKKYVDYVKREYKKKHYEEKKNLKKVTKELEKQGLISQNGIHNIKKFTNSQKKDKFIPVLSFSDFCKSRELSPDVELQTVISKPENEIEILDLDSRDSIFDTEAQNAPGPASNEDDGELFVTYSDLVKQNVFDNDPRMKGLSVFQQALFKIRPSKGIPFLQDDHQEVERVSPKKPNYTPTLAHAAIAAGKVDCDIMNKKKSIGTSTNPTPVSFHNKALSNIIGGALCSDKETLLAKSTTTSKLLSRSRSRSPNLYRRKSSLSGHSKSRSKSPTRSRTPPRAYRKRRVRSRSRTREKKRHKASSSPEFNHHLVYRPQRIRRSFSRSPSLEKWLPRSRSRSRPRYIPEPRSKHVERSRSRSISRSRYRNQAQARNRSRPRSKSRSRSRTRYRYRSPKVHRTPPPEPDRRYRRRSKSPFKSFADQLRSKLREENEKALAMLRKTIDQAAVTCKNAQAAAKVPSQESTSTRVSLDNPTQKYDKNSSVSKKYAIFKPSDLERLLPAEYSQFSSCGSPSSRSETSLSPKHRIPSPPPAALPSPKIPDVSVPPPCITAPPPPVPVPTTTVSVLEEQTEQIVVTTYTNYVPFVNPANPNLLQPTPPGTLTPYINPELSQYQYNNYMMPHTSIPPPHMFPPQMMGRFDQEMVIHPNVNQAHFPFMNQQQFHYPMGMPQFQNTAHPFPQTMANQSRNVSIVDISKQTVMTTGNIPQWSNDQTPVNETTSKPQLTWPQNLKQDQTIVIPQDASLKKDSILDQLNSGKTEQRFLNHLEGGTPPIDTSNFKSMCCVHSHFKPSSGFNLKNNPAGEVTEGRSNKTDNLSGTNRKQNESDDDCVIIIDTDKPVLKDVEEEEEGSRTSKTVTLGDLDDDRIKKENKAEKIKENPEKKIKLTLNFKPRPVKPIGLADVFDVANESDDGKISKVTESKITIKNVCDLLNSSNIKNSDKSSQNSYQTQQSFPEIDKNRSLRNPPPKQNSILNKANEEINLNTKEKDDKHDVGEDIKINKNKLDAVKVSNDDIRNVNVEHETIQEVTEEINTGNISVTGQKENNTSLQNEDCKSEEVEKKNTDNISVSIDLTEIEEIKPTNTSNGKNVEFSETSSNDTSALPKTVSSNPSYKKKINLENKINKLIQVLSSSSTSSEDSKTEINNLVDNILADEQSKTIINKSMNESPQNSNEKSDGQAVDMTKLKNKKNDNSCVIEKIQSVKGKTKDEHHAVLNVVKINEKTETVEKKRKDVIAVVNLDVGDKNKTVEKKRKVITAVIDLEVDEKTVEKEGKDTTTVVNLDVGDKNKTVEKKRKDVTAVVNLDVGDKNKTVEKKRKDITAVINLEVDEKTVEKKGKDTTTVVNLDVGDKNKTVEKKRKDVTPLIKADVDNTVAVLNLEMDEKDGLNKVSLRSKSKSKERKVDKGAKSKIPVTKSANTSDLSQLQNKTNSHSDEAEENSQSKHENKVKANTEEVKRSNSVQNNEVLVSDQLKCSSLDEDKKQSPINVSSKDSSVTAALQNRKPLKKNKDKVVNVGTDEVKSSKSSVRDTTNPEVQLSDDESSTTTRRTRGRNSKDTVKDTEENVRTSRGRSCKNKAESTTKSNTRLSRNNNNEADTENILEEISENKESTEMPKEMKSNKKGRKKKADETKLEESVIGAEIDTTQQNTTGSSENESNTLGSLNVVGNDTTLHEDKGVSETPADSVNQEMNTVSQSSDCAESAFQSAQTKVKTNKKSKKGRTVQDKAKDSETELLSLEVDVAKTPTESELSSVKPAGISGRDNGSSNILPETDVDADGALATQNSKSTRGRQKNKPPVKSDKKQAVKETTKNLSKSKIEDVSKTSAEGSTTVKINNYKDGEFPTNLNKKSKSEALQNTFYFPKDNDSAKSSGCNIDLPVEKPCPLSKKSLHYINMNFLVQRAAEEEEHRSVVKGLKLKTLQLKLTRIDDKPLTTISKASNKIGKKSVGRNKRKVSGNKHSKKILHVHNIIDSYAYSANTIRACDSHFSELEGEGFHPSYDESDNNAMSDIVICDVFSMSERQSEMMSQNIDLDDSCGLRTNFLFTHDDESNNCSIDKTVDSFTLLGKTANSLKSGSDFGDVEEMIEQDRKMDKMETIPVRYNGCEEFPKGDSDEPKTNTDVIVTNIKCPLPKSENNSINDDVNICVEKSKDDEKRNIFQELGFTDFFSDQDEGDVISIKNSCEKIIETLEAKINDSVEKVDSVIVNNTINVDKIGDVSIKKLKKTTIKKDCKDKSVINLPDCCDEKKDGNITNNKSSENSVPDVNLDCVNLKSNDSETSISSTIVNKSNIDSFPEKEKDISVTNLSKLDSIFITEIQNKSENNISVGASSKQPEAVGNSDNSSAKSIDSNKCTTDHNSDEGTEKKKNINEVMSLEDNKLARTSAVEDVQSVSPTTTGTADENKLMNDICKASIVDKSPPRDICENHKSVINILKSFRERPQPEQTEKKTTSLEVLQNETVINVVPLNVYLKVIEKQGKTKVNKINVEENAEEPFAASSSAVEICGAGDMVVDNKLEELAQNVINKQVSNSSEIVSDKTQEKCSLENVVDTESSHEQCVSAVEIINKNNVGGICKTNGNFQIDDSNSQTSSSKKDKESVSVDLLECVLPTFVVHKKKGKKKKSTKIETKVDLFSNFPATSTPQPIKNSLDTFNNEHDKSNSSISENLLFGSQKDTSLVSSEVSNRPTSGNEVNLTSGEVNSGAEKIIEDLSQNKSPVLIKKKGRKRKGKDVNQLTTKIKVQSTELSSSLLETQTLDLQEEEFSNIPCQIFDRNEKTSITVTEPTDCSNALVTNSSEPLNNEGSAVGSAENAVVFDGNKQGKRGRGRPKKIKPNNDKNTAGIDGAISYGNNEKQMEPLNIANGTIIDEDKIVNTKDSVKNDLHDDTNSHLMNKQIIECRNVIGEDGCKVQSKKDMLEDLDTHKTEKNHTIDLGKNEIENTFTVKQTETDFVNHKIKSDEKVNADIVMDKNCTVDKRTKSNFVDELSVASENAKCNVGEGKINGKDQEEEKKLSDNWASNDIPSTLKRRRGRPKKSSIVPEATENIMKNLNLRTRSSSPKLSEPLSKVRRGRSLQNAVPKVDVLKNEVNPINDLQDDTWDSSNHYSDFDFRNDYSDSESQSSCKNSKVDTRTAQVKPSSDVLTGEQDGDKSKMDVDNCFSFGMEFEELLQSEPLTGFGVFSKQTVSPQTKLVKPNSSTGTTSLPKKRGRPKRVVVNSDDSIELKNSVGSDKLFQLTSKDVSKVCSQNIEITSNSNFASELNTNSSHNEFDQSTDFEHLLEKEKLINLSSDDHPVTKPNDCPLADSQKNVNVEKNTSNKEIKETYGNIDEPLSNCLKSKKQRKSKSAKDSAIVLSETNLQTDPQTVTSVQVTDPNNTPKITRQSRKSKLSDESLGNIEIDKTKELKPTNTDNIQKDDMDIPTVTGDANVLKDNLCVDTTVSKSSNFNVTFYKNKTRKKKNELLKNSETRVTRQSNVLRDQQILPLEISQIVKDFLDSSEESSDVSHSGKRTEQKSSEIDSDVCSVSQTISKHQSNSDIVDSASAKLPAGIDEEDAGMKTQGSKMCKEICDSKTETLDSDASILETSKRKSLRTSSPTVGRVSRTLRSLQTSQQTTCEGDLVKDVDKSIAGVDDRNENVEINRLDAALTVAGNESIPIRKTRSGQVSKSNSRDSSPNIVKTAKKTKHCQEIPTCETQSIVAIKATTTEIQDLSSGVDVQPSKTVCDLTNVSSCVPKDQFQESKRRKCNKNIKDNDLLTENKVFAQARATRSSKYSSPQTSDTVSTRSLQPRRKDVKNNSTTKELKDLNKSESTDSLLESSVTNDNDSTLSPVSTPVTELLTNPDEKSHSMKEDTLTGSPISQETPKKRKKRRRGDDLSTWGQFKDIEDNENQSSDVPKKASTVSECSIENPAASQDDKVSSSNKLRSTRNRAETQDLDNISVNNTQHSIEEDKNNCVKEDVAGKTFLSDEILENKLISGKKHAKKNKKVTSDTENAKDCRGLDDEAIKEILEQNHSDKEDGKGCNVEDLTKPQTPVSSSCEIKNTSFDRSQAINLEDTLNTMKTNNINSVSKQKNVLSKKSRKRTQGEVFKAECSIKLDSFVNFSEMKSIYKDLQAKIQKITAVKLGSTIESNDEDSNNLDGAMDTDDVMSSDKFSEESYICTSKMSLTENKIIIVKQVKSKPSISTDACQDLQKDSLSTAEKPQKSVSESSFYAQEKSSNQQQTETTSKKPQSDKNLEENASLNTSIVADFEKANSGKTDLIIKLKTDVDRFGSVGQQTPKDNKLEGTAEENSSAPSLGAKKRRLRTSNIKPTQGPSSVESVDGEKTRTRRSCVKKTGIIVPDVSSSVDVPSEISCPPNTTEDPSPSNKEVEESDEVTLWNRISGFLNKDSRTSVSKKMSARKRKL